MDITKIKIIAGVLLIIIITASALTTPTTDSLKATSNPSSAPVASDISMQINKSLVFSTIDFSSFEALKTSIKDDFDQMYDSIYKYIEILIDYIEENYGSVDTFIKQIINAYKAESSST